MEIKQWTDIINGMKNKNWYKDLHDKIKKDRKKYNVLPEPHQIFAAYKLTPYMDTKIVILGQDPYPNKKHYHGLAFSSHSKNCPASLKNIFKEIYRSLELKKEGIKPKDYFKSNCLEHWGEQGVLLINEILTIIEGKTNSHKNIGWELFTKEIIKQLNNHPTNNIVFMLWGNNAKKYKKLITNKNHLVLTTAHPSPMNGNAFIGCDHFLKAKKFLKYNSYDNIYFDFSDYFDKEKALNDCKNKHNLNDNEMKTIETKMNEEIRWKLKYYLYTPIDFSTN